jgi:hypothetical protein
LGSRCLEGLTRLAVDVGPDDDRVRVIGIAHDEMIDAEQCPAENDEVQQRLAQPARHASARVARHGVLGQRHFTPATTVEPVTST